MRLLALVLLFIALPLLELYVIIEVVGEAIGPVWTILLLAADSLLGSVLLRSQGRAVWRRFNEAMRSGRMPHQEVLDGVLVIFGGAFLITPGFITDVIGLGLLIPPTRAFARRFVVRALERRAVVGIAGAAEAARERGRRRPGGDFDVEGTATERPEGAGERDTHQLGP